MVAARSANVCLNRASASAFDTYSRDATTSPGARTPSTACRSAGVDVVLQVDRHLGRAAPLVAEPLQVRGHEQEPAEDEQRQRDRRRRQQPGLAAAPQAGARFVERVAERAHQATSTTLP